MWHTSRRKNGYVWSMRYRYFLSFFFLSLFSLHSLWMENGMNRTRQHVQSIFNWLYRFLFFWFIAILNRNGKNSIFLLPLRSFFVVNQRKEWIERKHLLMFEAQFHFFFCSAHSLFPRFCFISISFYALCEHSIPSIPLHK